MSCVAEARLEGIYGGDEVRCRKRSSLGGLFGPGGDRRLDGNSGHGFSPPPPWPELMLVMERFLAESRWQPFRSSLGLGLPRSVSENTIGHGRAKAGTSAALASTGARSRRVCCADLEVREGRESYKRRSRSWRRLPRPYWTLDLRDGAPFAHFRFEGAPEERFRRPYGNSAKVAKPPGRVTAASVARKPTGTTINNTSCEECSNRV